MRVESAVYYASGIDHIFANHILLYKAVIELRYHHTVALESVMPRIKTRANQASILAALVERSKSP